MSRHYRHLIVGVDPGFTGAIAVFDRVEEELVGVYDMPVAKDKNGKVKLSLSGLGHLIGRFGAHAELVIIEDVGSMPGQGVSSTFRFGFAAGAVAGALAAHHVPIHFVKPAVWKLALGLTKNKKESLAMAMKEFENFQHAFRLQKHDGRAEAALLAKFGMRLV